MSEEQPQSTQAAQAATPPGRPAQPEQPRSSDRTVVLLGNSNPHMQVPIYDPETGVHRGFRGQPAKHLNQSVTRVEMRPGFDDREEVELALSTDNDDVLSLIGRTVPDDHRVYAVGIAEVRQVMQIHAGGAKPAWVESNDPGFAQAVAAFYGCPVGQPTALLTNGGRDGVHAQHLTTATQPAAFNYIALTASTTAPATSDTTLAGEITTGGGGLIRAQATYAHTSGTNTSTLTKTFTANGSDTLPVTIAQIGVFNAATVGTLAYHTALSATATLNVSGDNITVTETVTAG